MLVNLWMIMLSYFLTVRTCDLIKVPWNTSATTAYSSSPIWGTMSSFLEGRLETRIKRFLMRSPTSYHLLHAELGGNLLSWWQHIIKLYLVMSIPSTNSARLEMAKNVGCASNWNKMSIFIYEVIKFTLTGLIRS